MGHNVTDDYLCESGWTGDRCTFPLHHDGPHSNEAPIEEEAEMPHPYRPISASPRKTCGECFAIPSDPHFAEHHTGKAAAR